MAYTADLSGLLHDYLLAIATGRPLQILTPSQVVPGLLINVDANPLEYIAYILRTTAKRSYYDQTPTEIK